MIPYAVLSGDVRFTDNSHIEIRILDLSADYFTFRLSRRHRGKEIREIRLSFYSFEKCTPDEVVLVTGIDMEIEYYLTDSQVSSKSAEHFFDLFKVRVKNQKSEEYVKNLSSEYLTYINLKLSGDDGVLSKELTGYPAELDEVFPESIEAWRKNCFDVIGKAGIEKMLNDYGNPELSLNLNTPDLLQAFLNMPYDSFLPYLEETFYAGKIRLSEMTVSSIYIGNQFDARFLPDMEMVKAVQEKAAQLSLKVIFQFPPMRESQVKHFKKLLENYHYLTCYSATTLPEIIVNDIGLCELIKEEFPDQFKLTLGILLNKRRKDVRLPYKKGIESSIDSISGNGLNAGFYQEELDRRYQIFRYSYESCGYQIAMAGPGHILHLPYYQMNTGGMADRWEDEYVLYPSHLQMIGKANSLFGYDEKIFTDPKYLSGYLEQKPSRIVFEFI